MDGFRFFRVLLPGFIRKLSIPRDFAQRISDDKRRESATMLSPNGKLWHVDIYKEANKVYIGGDGWGNFAVDNSLGVGYFLVFHHKGNLVFGFRAFSASTHEIAYLSSTASVPKEERIEIEDGDISARNVAADQRREPSHEHGRTQCTSRARFEVTMEPSNLSVRRFGLSIPARFFKSCGLLNLKKYTKVMLRDPRGRMWPIGLFYSVKSRNIHFSQGWLAFARVNKLESGTRCTFEFLSESKNRLMMSVHILNGTSVTGPSELAGNRATPKNNSSIVQFEAVITPYSLERNYMGVPRLFEESNRLSECSEVTIRDPSGRAFELQLAHRHRGTKGATTYLRTGWLKFAQSSQLKVGDRCIFELVTSKEEQQKVLQVQILRN